jgi:hypothetical protein
MNLIASKFLNGHFIFGLTKIWLYIIRKKGVLMKSAFERLVTSV